MDLLQRISERLLIETVDPVVEELLRSTVVGVNRFTFYETWQVWCEGLDTEDEVFVIAL